MKCKRLVCISFEDVPSGGHSLPSLPPPLLPPCLPHSLPAQLSQNTGFYLLIHLCFFLMPNLLFLLMHLCFFDPSPSYCVSVVADHNVVDRNPVTTDVGIFLDLSLSRDPQVRGKGRALPHKEVRKGQGAEHFRCVSWGHLLSNAQGCASSLRS